MKKIIIIAMALSWVSLVTCPAYAGVEELKDPITLIKSDLSEKSLEEKEVIANGVDSLIAQADKIKEWDKQATKITEAQWKVIQKEKVDLQNKVKSIRAEKVEYEKKQKLARESATIENTEQASLAKIEELDIAFLVLIIITLLLTLGLIFFVWKIMKAVSKHDETISYFEEKLQNYDDKVKKLQELVSGLTLKTNLQKEEIQTLQSDLRKMATPVAPTQKAPVDEPKAYPEKIWYGKFDPSRNGFSVMLMTTQRENDSQFEIRQKSDNYATFTLLTDISKTLFLAALDGCKLLRGDTMSFSKIEVVREGSLELNRNTWAMKIPVEINLL